MTLLTAVDGVFLAAGAPVVDFAVLAADAGPVVFFSPTLPVLLETGAPAVPAGFLEDAEVGVLLFSTGGVVFFATPLVCGFDVPFEIRLWAVFGRGPDGVLGELVVLGLVLAMVLLVVLALESPEVLLLVLAAGDSLACFG